MQAFAAEKVAALREADSVVDMPKMVDKSGIEVAAALQGEKKEETVKKIVDKVRSPPPFCSCATTC